MNSFRERLYVVVPQNHRLASCSHARLAQIENDPFLLLKEGHCFRENTLSVCARARVQPNVVFESGHFAAILAMVAAGSGVLAQSERGARTSSSVAVAAPSCHLCRQRFRLTLEHIRPCRILRR
jgi:DNA-binding transcriptional LysR family regulator